MIKTSLDQHYKDREPQETVKIIKDFFENKGYTILTNETSSASGTIGYRVFLLKDKTMLATSNGKGMTKDYALASGLAELYERFANGCSLSRNPIILKQYLKENYTKNNYYYCKDEKELTLDEMLAEPALKNYYFSIFNNNITDLTKYVNFITKGKFYGIPYKSLLTDEIKAYYNLPLLYTQRGSNGMVAGNTYAEAFNQGLSELYERFVLYHFIRNCEKDITYKILNIDKLANSKLKNLIQNIKNDGNEFYAIDLSYTYDYPVILGILLNKATKNIIINFGSFPVFDIALERVITELYQNKLSFSFGHMDLQIPYKEVNQDLFLEQVARGGQQNIFCESLFEHFETVDDYNHQCFIDNVVDNNEAILNWNKEFIKRKNIEVLYRDNSLCSDMVALDLYSPQLSIQLNNSEKDISKIDTSLKNMALDKLASFYNKLDDYRLGKNINLEDLYKEYVIIYQDQKRYKLYEYITGQWNIVNGYYSGLTLNDRHLVNTVITFFVNNPLIDIKDPGFCDILYQLINITECAYKEEISNYVLLMRYRRTDYTLEELNNLFEQFKICITEEDYNKIDDTHYLLQKMFFEPFKTTFSEENVRQMLNGYF